MELFSHNVIFNELEYTFWNWSNEWKYPKAFWKHCDECFQAIKRLVDGLEFFWQWHGL
jgi:hypothetical protein